MRLALSISWKHFPRRHLYLLGFFRTSNFQLKVAKGNVEAYQDSYHVVTEEFTSEKTLIYILLSVDQPTKIIQYPRPTDQIPWQPNMYMSQSETLKTKITVL